MKGKLRCEMPQMAETRNRYQASMPEVEFPITYTEWMKLPSDQKAVALYINFYYYIESMAAKFILKMGISEEDILSTLMLAFIRRTVKSIEESPDKYNAAFIAASVRNVIIDLWRCSKDTENVLIRTDLQADDSDDMDKLSVFDNLEGPGYDDECGVLKDRMITMVSQSLKDNYPSFDKDTKTIINHLMRGKKLTPRLKNKARKVFPKLRKLLKNPSYYINISLDCKTFEDVIICKDLILSATVIMPDGERATWCGDSIIHKNGYRYGYTHHLFYRNETTYSMAFASARDLEVTNIVTREGEEIHVRKG